MPEKIPGKMPAIHFMGLKMHPLTMADTLTKIETAMATKNKLQQVVVNVAKVVKCQSDPELYEDVATSDLVNIDGMGVVWGARLCGHKIPERVAGIDIMHHTLKICAEKGLRPYFLGARQAVLDQAVENIKKTFPTLKIAGTRHGYFKKEEEKEIVATINQSKADCLFIAITSPLKERFMRTHKDSLNISFIMGVGGAVDIWAGITKRAPTWMQKAGLEWAYRIIQEPKRMWKRYLITNTKFIWLLFKELTSKNRGQTARK